MHLVEDYQEQWKTSAPPPDIRLYLKNHTGSREELVQVLLADQIRRWKTSQPLKVEDYLSLLPELSDDPNIKLQLAVGEFRARGTALSKPSIDEFTSRFSEISQTLRSRLSALISPNSHKPASVFSTSIFITDRTIGDRQLGRYKLQRILGEGSFGRVYLAYDGELQRQVAIKVPTASRFQSPEDGEQYLAEARRVASLNHPNIVPVYDVGRTEDGSVYVVSKFIEGQTLEERIRKARPAHDLSVALLSVIAQALHHAHERRLVHRDVTPKNILLEGDTPIPYVADFGLAIREEDSLRESKAAGTPAYMSPEQVRGEGHRLDGRSDIFSLGVIFYELLTGQRPFQGTTPHELFYQITSVDPIAPRELDASIPAELERICLKSLSKLASNRYASGAKLAEELSLWNQSPQEIKTVDTIVPKGLRSFEAEDADFFLDLLPGPRNRNGLPESIQFWKTKLEERDPFKTFNVGLIYGPSGCGKSSLVKAGLLPQLSKDVVALYVEATPDETETRILRSLQKSLTISPEEKNLVRIFANLRRSQGKKIILILDQFEQWLHANHTGQSSELISALRQCDGGNLQTVVMVRDDFAMAATRFMRAMENTITEGHNFVTMDLFDVDHAEKVLIKFGQAFGKLPANISHLNPPERSFITAAVSGLVQDGKVVPVRLALFAEMIKGKPWVPATLNSVGGTAGIGVNFLEEAFSSRGANPEHKLHQQAARDVLKALLPEIGSDIKGHMRSYHALLEIAGYQNRPNEFNQLLRMLDGELRLITPTDCECQVSSSHSPDSACYQLTHDYLVPSLREWINRKQQETRKGRAELTLIERASLWGVKPENRHLPSLIEWISIRSLTANCRWTDQQRKMMRKAAHVHGLQLTLILAGFIAVISGGLIIHSVDTKRQRNAEAAQIVRGLLLAETSQVKEIIENLENYRFYARDDLEKAFADPEPHPNAKLHAALAMLPQDKSVLPFLKERLLTVNTNQFHHVRDLLFDDRSSLVDHYWQVAKEGNDASMRFQAACALAIYSPDHHHWNDQLFCKFLADHLTSVQPTELLPWRTALRPVRNRLSIPLSDIYRDSAQDEQSRSFATYTLADYFSDNAEGLFDLLIDADEKQYEVLYNKLLPHREIAIKLGQLEVLKTIPPEMSEATKDILAKRQANSFVMLMRMNATDNVWHLLKESSDPRVRSYIIHWLKPRGGNPRMLVSQYYQETDVTIKRSLVLCMGEFDLSVSEKTPLIEPLLEIYRDEADAGLHGAVEWLLRKWKQDDQLLSIDRQIQQRENELAADRGHTKQWFINSQGQTFVLLKADTFLMGSPESELNHSSTEALHERRIGRNLAISSKEVTLEQWKTFSLANPQMPWKADQEQLRAYILTLDSPMIGMSWYEAAWYCNWLSEQEGIPESQWCYQPNQAGQYAAGMKAKDNFWELSGYRLPTEAEWEFACRAGSTSSRFYGATETLLPKYAWYQANGDNQAHRVASLKPNDYGLFDMQGNVYEWCYDLYDSYPTTAGVIENDMPSTQPMEDAGRRVLRGGSFLFPPLAMRSASRSSLQPFSRPNLTYGGFRPVRSYPVAQ